MVVICEKQLSEVYLAEISKMFFDGHVFKQNVVLGAETDTLTDLINISHDVISVYFRCAARWSQKT